MIAIARFWHSFARIEKAILLFCGAALLFFAGSAWSRSRHAVQLPPVFVDAPQVQNADSGKPGAPILVHVAGAVRKPGVLRLPAEARVAEALKRAGGAKPEGDLNALNLAQKLKDGQQILVPVRGKQNITAQQNIAVQQNIRQSGRTSKSKAAHPVNVNVASAEELQSLPGIGPALASRILAKRAEKKFSSMDDLDEVSGLGPKKLAAIQPFVRF